MAVVVISGVALGVDGEYPLDAASFTGDELHLIKQVSGVRAGELAEALGAHDYDLVVAFATIAARRAGRQVDPALLSAAAVGAISVNFDDEEAEERPLDSPPPNGNENASGGDAEPNANT